MNRRERWGLVAHAAALACAAFAVGAVLAGCGMPGAPQPPSLNLPEKVTDLAAARNGDQVTLTWTMPRRSTDKLLLKGMVQARLCRAEANTKDSACIAAGSIQFAPGVDAAFTETLPSPLVTGSARSLTYFVELVNRKGRSAGPSNAASVAAGQVPGAVAGLSAEMRRKGVLLAWQPDTNQAGSAEIRLTGIKLVRKLLTPPLPKPKPEAGSAQAGAQQGSGASLLTPPPEPRERTLLIDASAGAQSRALDEDIRFNEKYEYRAQRVAAVEANGQKLELAGPLSAPVEIETKNTFPPAVPTGLAAVGTAGESESGNQAGNETRPAIDLSWQPNTEPDLAGYIVYRRESDGEWQRISPAQPVVGPGFHDPNVTAGHTYQYAVSSIDQEGHESARSTEVEETVPTP
jgi:hypothetical protein